MHQTNYNNHCYGNANDYNRGFTRILIDEPSCESLRILIGEPSCESLHILLIDEQNRDDK